MRTCNTAFRFRRLAATAVVSILATSGMLAAQRTPPPLRDATRPDLVIQSLTADNVYCKEGNKMFLHVTATVKNLSSKTAADLSKNNPWNIVLIMKSPAPCPGEIAVHPLGGPAQLGPGAVWTGSATVCVRSDSGAYYLGMSADPNDAVKESNEKNNYNALPFNFPNPCKK